jgi:hypothetical protein
LLGALSTKAKEIINDGEYNYQTFEGKKPPAGVTTGDLEILAQLVRLETQALAPAPPAHPRSFNPTAAIQGGFGRSCGAPPPVPSKPQDPQSKAPGGR